MAKKKKGSARPSNMGKKGVKKLAKSRKKPNKLSY